MSELITFTRYTSPETLSKRYWLEDEAIQKAAAAQMYKGTAERITMPFADFKNELEKATSKQAFGYGVHPLNYPEKINIAVKGKENLERNTLSRSQDYFFYKGSGLMMLDYDPSPYGQSMTQESFINALVQVSPSIAQSARIVRGSVSAGIHKARQSPRTNKGFHVYIPVKETEDIKRYGDVLFKRLWLHGFGFIALSSNGALLERAIIDASVFSPERLDFVGKPVISGSDLEYTPPDAIYTEGGFLDTKTLLDLTSDEQSQFSDLIAQAKQSLNPQAEAKQKEWVKTKVNALVDKGVPTEKAKETIKKILDSKFQDLYGDFIIEFQTGSVSVDDILKDPRTFDNKACADPIEGSSYGTTTAMFYWNKGKPVIHSLAHGQATKYFLHKSPVKDENGQVVADWQTILEDHVNQFNKTHASVVIGGKHKIMRLESGQASHDDRDSYTFFNRNDLNLLHDNTIMQVGFNKWGEPIYKNEFMAWAKDTRSKSYTGGVVFLPAKQPPSNYFNTWRGFSVKPKENDALLVRLKYHMEKIVCSNHQDLYDYLVKWIAFTIQNPDKPAGSAIVLRGLKGSGKGTLGHFLKSLWGNHGLHISNAKHLIGNFNGHLNDVCFLFADEAFYSGDKQHEGVLKALITEPQITVERKGIDAIQQPNYLKIFMSTNAVYAVPASKDERRYFVSDVSDYHLGDRPYFNQLHKDCESKEVQAAFLHWMINIDLTDWHTGDIPDSIGLREQRYHSLGTVQQWVADCLINGSFINNTTIERWHNELNSDELFPSYIAWCNTVKVGEYRIVKQIQMSKYLGEVFTKKMHVNGRNKRGFALGSLEDAIGSFENHEKIKLSELIGVNKQNY